MSTEPPVPYELPDERVVAAWKRLIDDYLICEPLEPAFARRLHDLGARTFVELGSATGPISRLLGPMGVSCFAVDLNPPDGAFMPLVRGDLRALPVRPNAVDAVSEVNCLYFLADPLEGIAAARGILRPGGTFLASTPSRYHDPELAEVVPGWGEVGTFDAEEAEDLVRQVFPDVTAEWWEVPAFQLADRDAVVDYFVAFKQPDPEQLAELVTPPVTITKSGIDLWALK